MRHASRDRDDGAIILNYGILGYAQGSEYGIPEFDLAGTGLLKAE